MFQIQYAIFFVGEKNVNAPSPVENALRFEAV